MHQHPETRQTKVVLNVSRFPIRIKAQTRTFSTPKRRQDRSFRFSRAIANEYSGQDRSQSPSAISDMRSPVKLVRKIGHLH